MGIRTFVHSCAKQALNRACSDFQATATSHCRGTDVDAQMHLSETFPSMKYKQETIKPYDSSADKTSQVKQMFDSIAHSYDLLNHTLSLGVDKYWRRRAVQSVSDMQDCIILDVATGTGDFALQLSKKLGTRLTLGIDLSKGMIERAKAKVEKRGGNEKVRFKVMDCLDLRFRDERFDLVSATFGIRNFSDLEGGLKEMRRVLKPGGRLLILELTAPRRFPMKQLFKIYSHVLIPLLGKLISRDAKAYSYLPATMEVFPQGEEMHAILQRIGFERPTFKRMTFGLCTLYNATKPQKE